MKHHSTPEDAKLVPVGIDFEARLVELLDLEGETYSEPFFHETIERRRAERPAPQNARLDVEAFLRVAAQHREPPGGFIFHVGRCGSTLLANMLSASGEHLLIKEPGLVSDLIAGWLNTGDRGARQDLEGLIAAALRCLLSRAGTRRYKVLKFAAWNVRMAGPLLRLFPDTPAVFVYRPPSETVASLFFQRPAWFDLLHCPRSMQARFFPTLCDVPEHAPLSPALLFAHAWRSVAEAALAQPPDRLLLLEYHEMIAGPVQAIERVLTHFRHVVNTEQQSTMAAARRLYSKDPQGREAYDGTGLHRRPALSPSDEDVVRAVTGDVWCGLEARRAGPPKRVPVEI